MKNSDSDFYHDDPIELHVGSGKKKLPSLLAFLVLVVGGTFFIQTTLASNMSLNPGNPVEFGQGISAATACSGDNQLLVTPHARFWNSSGSGSFRFESVTVSGIPDACHGSDFTINAYGNDNAAQLALFNSTSTTMVIYNKAGTFEAGVGAAGMTVSGASGAFTVVFANPVAVSSSIFKITIQSGPHTVITCALGGSCAVGDLGPGGGRIFYVAAAPFTCGPILEATCSYLEAASTTGNAPWADGNYQWSGVTATRIGTLNTAIGFGFVNTNSMIGQSSTSSKAATISQAYRGPNNLDDWFLPSKDELNQMCKWARGVPWISDATRCSGGLINTGLGAQGFGEAAYWSSSEPNAVNNVAWTQAFTNNGTQYDATPKSNNYWVRPIRAF